jgi:hypothetical protein
MHGRNHQQREAHVRRSRARSTPDHDTWEAELFYAGRKRGRPPDGLIGAHTQRRAATPPVDSHRDRMIEPVGPGSDVGPTARAAAGQQKRHARERAAGRTAAGTMGLLKARLEPGARGAPGSTAVSAAGRAGARGGRGGQRT